MTRGAHPDAARLDQLSLGAWLRLGRARFPAVRRRYALGSLSLSCDGPDRSSLLADLRKHAPYSQAMASMTWGRVGGPALLGLGSAGWRCGWPPNWGRACGWVPWSLRVELLGPRGVVVGLADGEELRAEAVVCAGPPGRCVPWRSPG